MKQRGLGKGLGALIDSMPESIEPEKKETNQLDVNEIDTDRKQPRKNFDAEKLEELANPIKEHGVLQPIVVNQVEGRYQIIAGERRYRAARIAGLKKVPVVIKNFDSKKVLEASLIENIQREDLNPLETADAIKMLMSEYQLTQEEVAQSIGKSRSAVANFLRLLELPKSVKSLVISGQLSGGHARCLLSLGSKQAMEKLAKKIIEEGLSVRQAEQLVKEFGKEKPEKKQKASLPEITDAEEKFTSLLGTKVAIKGSTKKGKIEISYFSWQQLDDIYALLSKIGKN